MLREKLAEISFDELQSLSGATLYTRGDVANLTAPAVSL
jgi:hypothetical protein